MLGRLEGITVLRACSAQNLGLNVNVLRQNFLKNELVYFCGPGAWECAPTWNYFCGLIPVACIAIVSGRRVGHSHGCLPLAKRASLPIADGNLSVQPVISIDADQVLGKSPLKLGTRKTRTLKISLMLMSVGWRTALAAD